MAQMPTKEFRCLGKFSSFCLTYPTSMSGWWKLHAIYLKDQCYTNGINKPRVLSASATDFHLLNGTFPISPLPFSPSSSLQIYLREMGATVEAALWGNIWPPSTTTQLLLPPWHLQWWCIPWRPDQLPPWISPTEAIASLCLMGGSAPPKASTQMASQIHPQ